MYLIDNSTAAATQPASTAQGTAGWFTDGNAAGGIAATIVPAEWLNALQAELSNLVTETGQTLTKNKFTQVAQAIQSGKLSYGTDTGAANAYVVTYPLPFGSLFTGLVVSFQALHTNTGSSTLNVSGLGASPIYGGAHTALQGNEILAGGFIEVTWNAALNSGAGAWVLLEQTGGATQVSPATQSQHAVQFGQLTGLVGSMRNAAMNITVAASSATFTADQIVVASALNGLQYLLSNYNKTINLATTGAGGMDTGSPPVAGYVGIYAIYNPTTSTTSILATNATSAVVPNVYGGANMPAGYTASALISVWRTNASSQFIAGVQTDRTISIISATVLNVATTQASYTALNISTAVPFNAKSFFGSALCASTSTATLSYAVAASATGIGASSNQGNVTQGIGGTYGVIPIATAQTLYYQNTASAGSTTFTLTVSGYTI